MYWATSSQASPAIGPLNMRILLLLLTILIAGCGQKKKPLDEFSLPLSEAAIEQIMEEAIEVDALEYRNGISYVASESEAFTGWAKKMYAPGQLEALALFKNGKLNGPSVIWYKNGQKLEAVSYLDGKLNGSLTRWHKNGQKLNEGTYKSGKPDGLFVASHENGQKRSEETFKDGEKISGQYWNSKGGEVSTLKESR